MDPISIISAVISVASVASASAVAIVMSRAKRHRKNDEEHRQAMLWEFKDEAHRARYAEYQRVRQEQGKGRDPVTAAVAATAPPKPFDPLDPNTDKGWCMACPPNHPTGGLHKISEMKFPPSSTLWLCPDCYDDYVDPEAVLGQAREKPEESEEPPKDWGRLDRQIVAMSQTPPNQVTLGQFLKGVMLVPPNRSFTCYWCNSSFISKRPVPEGRVLCESCTQQLKSSSCHYCGNQLAPGTNYGLMHKQATCEDCMESGAGDSRLYGTCRPCEDEDELSERRRRKMSEERGA